MFLMWAVMMVGLMLPSAAPMILMITMVNRRKQSRGRDITSPGVFAAGYLAVWTAFSLAATLLQWLAQRSGALTPMMATTSAVTGGIVLVAAGVYQWTPLKTRCLRHCQSPLHFISTHWRDGAAGALRMGWWHGLYCLGCCWFLMGLLFVGGIMNLVWIAGLTVFVLVEKLWPARWISATSGLALVVWGAVVILRGV
jgi:predicted metal-binding membrane protein